MKFKLTESERERISRLYNTNETNEMLLEFTTPQGLEATLNTPFSEIKFLPCNSNECQVIFIRGKGGTFKYNVTVEYKALLGSVVSGIKYRNFKDLGSEYYMEVYPTNTAIMMAFSAIPSKQKVKPVSFQSKGGKYTCNPVGNADTNCVIKMGSSIIAQGQAPLNWEAKKEGTYTITKNIVNKTPDGFLKVYIEKKYFMQGIEGLKRTKGNQTLIDAGNNVYVKLSYAG